MQFIGRNTTKTWAILPHFMYVRNQKHPLTDRCFFSRIRNPKHYFGRFVVFQIFGWKILPGSWGLQDFFRPSQYYFHKFSSAMQRGYECLPSSPLDNTFTQKKPQPRNIWSSGNTGILSSWNLPRNSMFCRGSHKMEVWRSPYLAHIPNLRVNPLVGKKPSCWLGREPQSERAKMLFSILFSKQNWVQLGLARQKIPWVWRIRQPFKGISRVLEDIMRILLGKTGIFEKHLKFIQIEVIQLLLELFDTVFLEASFCGSAGISLTPGCFKLLGGMGWDGRMGWDETIFQGCLCWVQLLVFIIFWLPRRPKYESDNGSFLLPADIWYPMESPTMAMGFWGRRKLKGDLQPTWPVIKTLAIVDSTRYMWITWIITCHL